MNLIVSKSRKVKNTKKNRSRSKQSKILSQKSLNSQNLTSNNNNQNLTNKNLENNFDEIITNYLIQGKLFNFSINKGKQTKIIDYFSSLFYNNNNNEKIIFLISPAQNGQEHLIKYLIKNFKCFTFNFNINNINFNINDNNEEISPFINIINIINNNKDNLKHVNNIFLIIKNFPVDLYIKRMKNEIQFLNLDFLNEFKSTLISFLNEKKNFGLFLVFFWEDEEIKEYFISKVFGKKILYHNFSRIIKINLITENKIKNIIIEYLKIFGINCFDNNNYNEFLNNILFITNGNLYQLKNYLKQFIYQEFNNNNKNFMINKNFFSQSNNNKNFNNNNNKFREDNSIFHLLGRVLYNKRFSTKLNKIIYPKKKEYSNNFSNLFYFNIQTDIINNIPIFKEKFNELFIENIYDHIKSPKNLSNIFDVFSFTDKFAQFQYKLQEKNFNEDLTLENDKFYLNFFGYMIFNDEQYEKGEKLKKNSFNKSTLIANNNVINNNKKLYEECGEFNPSIFLMSLKKFCKDVLWLFKEIKNYNKINFDENLIENLNNNFLNEDETVFNNKFKSEEEKEIENFEEKKNNKNNFNVINHVFIKKFRNFKEENEKNIENLIDFFDNNFDNNNKSDDDIDDIVDD